MVTSGASLHISQISSDCVHRLPINLRHMRAGNAVLVKLVDAENSVPPHECFGYVYEDAREHPNISVSHVTFNGSHIVLPDSVALSC